MAPVFLHMMGWCSWQLITFVTVWVLRRLAIGSCLPGLITLCSLGGPRSVIRRCRSLLVMRKLGGSYFLWIVERLLVLMGSLLDYSKELVRGYHLNSGKPHCTLKVDLQKAYDSINWDFLFGLLIAISTPLKFVSWIKACMTSPMFSIMINGSLEGFFHGRKGVRQGNPLSPFFFVMVMDVFSRMLNKPPQGFQFHQCCEKVKLTRLTFADDLMIFCVADEPSLSFVRETLQKFGELLGLYANLGKISIFVAGSTNEVASRLAANMGFILGNLPVRYLSLPLLTGRLRPSDCAPLIQRITSRIRSWNARVLSFAGRFQLVRSVFRSLQVYWASAYILKRKSLWAVDSGVCRSWCLRAILRKRDSLKYHVWIEVGDGSSCRVWLDPWLQGVPILEQVGERVLYDAASRREARLSEFIGPDGEWQWPRVSIELIDLWDRVQAVRPCLSVRDRWVWVPSHQGGFSIASALDTIRPRGGRVRWVGLLWGGGNVPKHSFCAWLTIKNKLGTRDRLHRWDSSVPMSFILCQGGVESRDHLFFSCPFGRVVWSRVLQVMASSHRIRYWGVELSWICHQGIGMSVRRKLWRVLLCATTYFIWKEWNHRLHGGQARHLILIFQFICTCIRARVVSWREDTHLLI
ncbi:hypothetical protein IC582_028778 [Cucumis melo]